MRHIVPVVLLLLALIHALPLIGVLGAERLAQLYGVPIADANLDILLRHRAVLFGVLAAFLGHAAWQPELHRLALLAAFVSVVSFLVLTVVVGGANAALGTVARVDFAALALLLVGALVHARAPAVTS